MREMQWGSQRDEQRIMLSNQFCLITEGLKGLLWSLHVAYIKRALPHYISLVLVHIAYVNLLDFPCNISLFEVSFIVISRVHARTDLGIHNNNSWCFFLRDNLTWEQRVCRNRPTICPLIVNDDQLLLILLLLLLSLLLYK